MSAVSLQKWSGFAQRVLQRKYLRISLGFLAKHFRRVGVVTVLAAVWGFLTVAASGNTRPFSIMHDGAALLFSSLLCVMIASRVFNKKR